MRLEVPDGVASLRLPRLPLALPFPPRRLPRTLLVALLVVVTFAVSAGIGYWRASLPASTDAGAVPTRVLLAADDLESRLGGSGVTFQVVQQQVAHALPGGSPLVDPNASPGAGPTDMVYMARDLSHGFARGDVFYEEIRGGLGPGDSVDWNAAIFEYGILLRDGKVWRSDGSSWYPTVRTNIPGLGIDPFSLTKIPDMLRSLAKVSDEGADAVGGASAERYSGLADSAGWPGIVASDGLLFTSSPINLEVWVGPGDRLLRMVGSARNLNRADADLVIQTDVIFGDQVPATIPEPSPLQTASPQAGSSLPVAGSAKP